MSRTSTLIVLGVLIIITPFSGFPMGFRSFLLFVFGVAVLGIALSLRSREVHHIEAGADKE